MKQATRIKRGVRAASMAAALLLSTSLPAQNTASLSEASFLHPDRNLYPETYFHFLDGNLSKEGIDADLQALSEAGISGLYWYHGTGGKWGGASAAREKAFEKPNPKGRIVPEGWTVRFPEGWGAPAGPIALEELRPWKDLDLGEEGRAFSGTATYEAVFKVDEKLVGEELILNLGCVDMIADVKVNGKSAGVRWTAPFRLPIGEMVHAGDNHLTIDVTSTWFNRLTYDAARPEAEKKTWTTYYPAPGGPLRPSGLMGPVNIEY